MKLPKPSKQGIKNFFLYHTEKLIIGLALLLMGAFFWMGYKAEVFKETTPDQLEKMADQADQYIRSNTSWEMISDSRQADREFLKPILNNPGISASKFKTGTPSVIVKSLEPRKDPQLRPVTELQAVAFKSPFYLGSTKRLQDPFKDLGWANQVEEDEDDDRRDSRRRQPVQRRPRAKDEVEEIKIPGEELPLVQQHEMAGIRLPSARVGNQDYVFLLNSVAVTGVVNVKQQFADFQSSFSLGVGYFPERDRPVYNYVQVERTEVVDGKPAQWKDISERLWDVQPSLYPSFAPEVVSPDNFDEVLTGPIPPITLVDYTPFSLHPKTKKREFPELEDAEEAIEADQGAADLFNKDEDDEAGGLGRRATRGSRRGRGAQRGMMSQRTSRLERPGRRQGSDFSKYEDAMAADEPTADHKLVRFYDLQTVPGRTYQYRVRVWVADPNNDIEEGLKKAGQKRGAGRGGMDMDMDMEMGMEDYGMDMEMEMGGGRGGSSRGRRGEELGPDGKPKKKYEKIAISENMISPEARERLSKAREEVDPDDSDRMIYYVSEKRIDENGNETFEEIQVPRGREELDDLRFSRPTPWSDPVAVTIKPANAKLAAGRVQPPREARVGDARVPDGEPVAEVAVSVWSNRYKTLLPAKRMAHRGEVMNFTADAHLLNPRLWSVHRIMGADIDSNLVVVDVMGGEELNARRDELLDYSLPGEVLVMDSQGNFKVHNDLDDQRAYRHALFIHDDSPEVGEVKVEKVDKRRARRGERDF